MVNKLFQYYLDKGDKKSAPRVKKPFFLQDMPHQKAIRKERRMKILFEKFRDAENITNLNSDM